MPLRGGREFRGRVRRAGRGEADAARQHLEDAVDLFLQSGAPFEVARARIELARALAALGRASTRPRRRCGARSICSRAAGGARNGARARRPRLAAVRAARRAPRPGDRTGGLTKRELEVLRLVAEGLSNQTIAEQLFVSDHTVHRHLANILSKLSVSTRAAAVAQAARRGLLS